MCQQLDPLLWRSAQCLKEAQRLIPSTDRLKPSRGPEDHVICPETS